jgi:16S rRNA (cytosine1402-N4)-methyltransferase
MFMPRGQRSTPAGTHRPVMLNEVLAVLAPGPGSIVVDATLGGAGHAEELLRRVGPTGRLIGLDRDPVNIPPAQDRLAKVGHPFSLHHANFAALPSVLAAEGVAAVDAILADLGMSSMQVDDPQRGFSYRRDGPLDMRMDQGRGQTAAKLIASVAEVELAQALAELGDEPEAGKIAAAIVAARSRRPITRTAELAQVIIEAVGGKDWRLHPRRDRWQLHPAARTFQALRLLVNRELPSLEHLLRVLPEGLQPGGTAAIISFHSGEDRLVKTAFRAGLAAGTYASISPEPLRPGDAERTANPRSRSAKLRWARRAGAAPIDGPDPNRANRSPT